MATAPAKNDGLGNKAADLVARQEPGDAPSEVDVDIDWDFVAADPTDYMPYLKQHKVDPDSLKGFILRWCETDRRVWSRRQNQGWVPVAAGKIRRGSTILCMMPEARRDAFRKRIDQRTKDLSKAPMRRLQQEADKFGGRHINMFDGDRGPRDGL